MDDRPLLHLVSPRWGGGTSIHRTFGHRMPPMALLVLAALARRVGWNVRVIDENYDPLPDERPDCVAMPVWTTLAPRAYVLADAYRARGIPVVMGGVHASLLPGEALRHADAVVSGEADGIFGEVLADALAGTLRPLYQGEWHGMEEVPTNHEWADIVRKWPIARYAPMNTIQTTRGCRFNCDFCSVIRINGRGSRHRDPEVVVEEIKVLKRSGQHLGDFAYVFFLDDDLAADLDYAHDLSAAILRSGVKVTWGAQASIGLAKNSELLELTRRAGLKVMFTGFESVSRDSLIECNKKNRPGEYGELIEAVHQKGMAVEGGFIFGFDNEGPDVFDDTVKYVDRMGVDVAHFSILTPYPGTQTFARMVADDRVTSFDWKRYNLYQVVYEPAGMTPQQLHDGVRRAYKQFYALRPRLRRLVAEARRRDPRFHTAMTICGQNYHDRYRQLICSTDPGYEAHPDDIALLTKASAAPAQEALSVAFAGAAGNVRITRKPPAPMAGATTAIS